LYREIPLYFLILKKVTPRAYMSEAVADIPVMIMWSSLSTCHGAPVLLEEDTGKLQQSLAHLAPALALEVPQETDRIFRTPSQSVFKNQGRLA
jgi:hypothetical protein